MRRLSIALLAAASAIAFSQIASAADLPRKAPPAPPPPPPAVYSWTGCYVGANAGFAWGHSNINTTWSDPQNIGAHLADDAITATQSPGLHPDGFTGGGQIGCNWQTNNFVFGGETDFDYMGLRKSVDPIGFFPFTTIPFFTHTSVKTDWLYTLRGRVGYAWNNWLLYATGGLAVTRLKFDTAYNNIQSGFLLDHESASLSSTRTGWTVGGGVETAFAPRWTAKIEYLYADFGTADTSGCIAFPTCLSLTWNHRVPLTVNIVRAGLNYKFY